MTINWDYIAGFFDGEGSVVHISGGSYRIAIAQSNKEVLDIIANFLGEYGIHTWITYKQPTKLTRSPGYHLAFSKSTSVRFFLETIIDKIIVKRKRAIEVLENLTNETRRPVSDAEQRAMVIMDSIGLSQHEIGNLLGRSQGLVSNNLQRRAVS